MNTVVIPLSRTRLIPFIAGSLFFAFLGLYPFTSIAEQQTRYNPTFLKVAGIVDILFFGASGIYGIKKLFDKKAGLIIDDTGITDNSNASGIGLIKWADITKIKTKQVMSTKFLLIYVRDPDAILANVTGMKRRLLQGNMKMYGTPLSITSNTLKYNFDDLEKLLKDRLNEQNKTAEK